MSQSGPSGTRTYRRDGADVLAPVIADGSATYVPGVSERRSGATRALHLDRLGSAHRQTDSAGTLAASVQRDAFGGALAGGFGTWRGPYAFAGAWGYEEDGDTGLVHVGHRL